MNLNDDHFFSTDHNVILNHIAVLSQFQIQLQSNEIASTNTQKLCQSSSQLINLDNHQISLWYSHNFE